MIVDNELIELFTTAYPRSGQTWLGRLLSDILDCPWQIEPHSTVYAWGLTGKGKYVIRKRHTTEKLPGASVFIYRDPRDVLVSKYYYNEHPDMTYTLREMLGLETDGVDYYGAYKDFVYALLDHPEKYAAKVRYEDLHDSPIETLKMVVNALTDLDVSDEQIALSYDRQQFSKILECYPEYHHSMRRGAVGDYANHFTQEDGKEFDKFFGDLMMEQGYITNRDWWRELPDRRCV